jgi:phosphate/sulfate permease
MPANSRRTARNENLDAERAIARDNAEHHIHHEHPENQGQSLRYALNRVMMQISRMILALLLVNFIVQAFNISFELGARSIAATILPILLIGYIVFNRSSRRSEKPLIKIPSPMFYFLSGIWVIALLILTRYAYYYTNRQFPFGEIALSTTLAAYIASTDRLPFRSLIACAYGIISGVLIFILVFGWAL